MFNIFLQYLTQKNFVKEQGWIRLKKLNERQ